MTSGRYWAGIALLVLVVQLFGTFGLGVWLIVRGWRQGRAQRRSGRATDGDRR